MKLRKIYTFSNQDIVIQVIAFNINEARSILKETLTPQAYNNLRFDGKERAQ